MDTYSIRIVWSDDDEGYVATSPEFEDLSAFGTSAGEAIAELEAVIRIAIETYRDSGWSLPEPKRVHEHSGQLRVRLPKSLHARLADEAERDGVSLNTLIVTFLSERIGEAGASRRDTPLSAETDSHPTPAVGPAACEGCRDDAPP
jgi:predicted RNase H-like HicB family nuclease